MKHYRKYFMLVLGLLVTFALTTYADWEQSNGPSGLKIKALAISGEIIYAGSKEGLFKSTNSGANWSKVNGRSYWPSVTAIAVKGDTVFAGTEGSGVYFSSDRGETWAQTNTGLTNYRILCLAVCGENVFAGTNGGGVFLSSTNRTSWTTVNSGLTDLIVQCFSVDGNRLLAGTNLGGVFKTTNNGASWTGIGSDANGLWNTDIRSVAAAGNNLYAGTYGAGTFLSTDNGVSWEIKYGNSIDALLAVNNRVYIGERDRLLLSTDTLRTMTGFPISSSNRGVFCFAIAGNYLYVGTADGVAKFDRDITQRKMVNCGLSSFSINAFSSSGANLFASGSEYGVFISKDSGASWSNVSYGITNNFTYNVTNSITSVAAAGKNVFATSSGGVYRSTDTCTNWGISDSGLSYNINTVCAVGCKNNVYVGTTYGGVYKSTDNGEIWSPISCLGTVENFKILKANENNIFAVDGHGGAYKIAADENCGQRIYIGSGEKEILNLAVNNDFIFAATTDSGIIYKSADNGTSWMPCSSGLAGKHVGALAVSDKFIFASTSDSSIYVSSINNVHWTKISSNSIKFPVGSLTVYGDYLIAGSYGWGAWRVPLSDIIGTTEIVSQKEASQDENNTIRYLSSNSEVATINFTLPHSDLVSVKVYSISGQEIATLTNNRLQSGAHSIYWNTKGVGSGCYVARMAFGGKNYKLRMMVSK